MSRTVALPYTAVDRQAVHSRERACWRRIGTARDEWRAASDALATAAQTSVNAAMQALYSAHDAPSELLATHPPLRRALVTAAAARADDAARHCAALLAQLAVAAERLEAAATELAALPPVAQPRDAPRAAAAALAAAHRRELASKRAHVRTLAVRREHIDALRTALTALVLEVHTTRAALDWAAVLETHLRTPADEAADAAAVAAAATDGSSATR